MTEPVTVFDVDGVLADFTLHFTRLANRHHGTPVYPNGQQRTWDFKYLTEVQETQLWSFIKDAPNWWTAIDDLTTFGDKLAMAALPGRIVYMTSRVGRHPGRQSKTWLETHGFPEGEVVVSHDKLASISSLSGFTGVIEDKPSTLEALHLAGVYVVARDWPYNREAACSARVSSVAEFCQKIADRLVTHGLE